MLATNNELSGGCYERAGGCCRGAGRVVTEVPQVLLMSASGGLLMSRGLRCRGVGVANEPRVAGEGLGVINEPGSCREASG